MTFMEVHLYVEYDGVVAKTHALPWTMYCAFHSLHHRTNTS